MHDKEINLGKEKPFKVETFWDIAEPTEQDLRSQLLKNRNIDNPEKFFSIDYERDSHDPFLMPDMEKSVDRIMQAFSSGEKVAVFGDYDADGIPGTAILYKVFQANNVEPVIYIPDREKEGYGLNNEAIEHLAKQDKVGLIITVDLGITGKKEVEFAKGLGVDVIVTDHHEPKENEYPDNAFAVVHPRSENSKYPFGYLAGGGVSWKLAQAIAQKTGKPTSSELKWLLELPAISTFCDMVPLQDENRMIAKFGLKVLPQTRNLGLRALYRSAGIDTNNINEFTVGFQIGPRLNAPGRMDHAALAFKLLTTNDSEEASQIAAKVEHYNHERRISNDQMQAEALEQIYAQELYKNHVIIAVGENWQFGLVGLVASRIMEEFHKPVFLLGKKGDIYQGSGRSIDGFHLVDALVELDDLLKEYGGHEKAAGMTIEAKNLEEFKKRITKRAEKILTKEQLQKRIKVDAVLESSDVNKELIADLEEFAPFGEGNPRPRFAIKNLTCSDIRTLGVEGKHLKIKFAENDLEAIGFGMGDRVKEISTNKKIDVLGYLELNVWTGRDGVTRETVQINMKDFKASRS